MVPIFRCCLGIQRCRAAGPHLPDPSSPRGRGGDKEEALLVFLPSLPREERGAGGSEGRRRGDAENEGDGGIGRRWDRPTVDQTPDLIGASRRGFQSASFYARIHASSTRRCILEAAVAVGPCPILARTLSVRVFYGGGMYV